jgi:hypothetical protein
MSAYGVISDIQQRIELVYVDDDTAKERAKALVDGHDVELWQLDRKIADFKARN